MKTLAKQADTCPHRSFLRSVLVITLSIVTATLTSCGAVNVKFYEKEHLGGPLMSFAGSATETHFVAKTMYSREASVGGVGTSAGGGCGCY